jgi:hypothetical protein
LYNRLVAVNTMLQYVWSKWASSSTKS